MLPLVTATLDLGLHWICGVKLKPKAVSKPLHYFIWPERDKPGVFTTVSECEFFFGD